MRFTTLLSTVVAFIPLVPIAKAQTPFQVGNTTVQTTILASDLRVPWDLVLGPDGWIWFTQASGEVYRLHPDDGTLQLIYTVPDVVLTGFTAGLHSMAFHPDFANEPYVYLHYLTSTTSSVIKRFLYDAGLNTFTSMSDHLLSIPIAAGPSHNGSRIIVDDAGMFMISIGETMNASASAQDPNTSHGKILRFDPEGGIPADNPVPGSYVYNWGHRNPQGLVKAANGHIYNSAHGAANDDEVNIVLPNRNYGWPTVLGLCDTPTEQTYCDANDVLEPIHEFTSEVVAPSGIDYFDHASIPEWQNSILVATLRGKELRQLKLDATGDAVLEDNTYLSSTYGRLRDVLIHPDGRVFISTSNYDWAGVEGPLDDRIIVLSGPGTTTSITEQSRSPWILLPNPASATVSLAGVGAGAVNVTVFEAAGKLVLRSTALARQFDVSGLSPGVYTVHVREVSGSGYVAKLVVEGR